MYIVANIVSISGGRRGSVTNFGDLLAVNFRSLHISSPPASDTRAVSCDVS